jgi:hypothetical protein
LVQEWLRQFRDAISYDRVVLRGDIIGVGQADLLYSMLADRRGPFGSGRPLGVFVVGVEEGGVVVMG